MRPLLAAAFVTASLVASSALHVAETPAGARRDAYKSMATDDRNDLRDPDGIPMQHFWLLDPGSGPSAAGSVPIPRILNKVYIKVDGGFDTNMSAPLKAAHRSWTERNPGYEVRYYDLDDCRDYLSKHFHPLFLRVFDCLEAFAAKADIFRYAVVYREGGWYSDWKTVCLEDKLLDKLSQNGTKWFSGRDEGKLPSRYTRMQTAFFGAVPRHPVLAATIRRVLRNVGTADYGKSPIHPTGPGALGEAFQNVTASRRLDGVKVAAVNGVLFMKTGNYYVGGRKIVQTKCDGCGGGQAWPKGGNNYHQLWKRSGYFCSDAKNLLQHHHEEVLTQAVVSSWHEAKTPKHSSLWNRLCSLLEWAARGDH